MFSESEETAALVSELNSLEINLGDLEESFVVQETRLSQALVFLEKDGGNLERLESMLEGWLAEPDLFRDLSLDYSEEFHSNFLAWLLNPAGSHGLGHRFLREFLAASRTPLGALPAADMPSTTTFRERWVELSGERGRLDILVLNENVNFMCVVENKVWSLEGDSQLRFYRRALEAIYPDYTVHRVFLTPSGSESSDSEEHEHWTAMSYQQVLHLVERIIEERAETNDKDVAAFLRQYAATLRRNIVPDVNNDVHELARRIYRKHQRAIEHIIEYRERYDPNYISEAYRILQSIVDRSSVWRGGRCDRPYVRFLSKDWERYEDELKLAGWPDQLLLFEVHITNSSPRLYLSLCPDGKAEVREQIFRFVREMPSVFNCGQAEFTDALIVLHDVGDLLEESDYKNIRWDEELVRSKLQERLDEFASHKFVEINEAILECLEDYKVRVGNS